MLVLHVNAVMKNAKYISGDILENICKIVVQESKQIVPVDTGYLRDHIGYDIDIAHSNAHIIADADYAGYVEWGTSRMKAQPYLLPAIENVRNRLKIR